MSRASKSWIDCQPPQPPLGCLHTLKSLPDSCLRHIKWLYLVHAAPAVAGLPPAKARMPQPLRSSAITAPSPLLRVVLPLCPRLGAQSLTGITPSAFSLRIEAISSHVPSKSLIQSHAAFEPDAAKAGLQDSAMTDPRATISPGFDINHAFSAVHRRFAFARLSGPCLMGSRPFVSATLTNIALNGSNSRWFEP